jgi:hypothetical protein
MGGCGFIECPESPMTIWDLHWTNGESSSVRVRHKRLTMLLMKRDKIIRLEIDERDL